MYTLEKLEMKIGEKQNEVNEWIKQALRNDGDRTEEYEEIYLLFEDIDELQEEYSKLKEEVI